jgi:cbb3-type cytochrome oxidase maturation protein
VYFPYFIAYMTVGFGISLVVFFWALNSGQFRDQQRARFIPLETGANTEPIKASRFARIETIALFTFVCLGLAASAAVVTFALLKAAQ